MRWGRCVRPRPPTMRDTLRSPRQQQLRALLQDLRKRHGLTQAQVAKRLAKTQSFVAKYEGDERRLSVIEFIDVVVRSAPSPPSSFGN
jgi:ParB-like chromosome segregation protein Spo0J